MNRILLKSATALIITAISIVIAGCSDKNEEIIKDGPLTTHDIYLVKGDKLESIHEQSFQTTSEEEFFELKIVSAEGVAYIYANETDVQSEASLIPYGIITAGSAIEPELLPDGLVRAEDVMDESVIYDIVDRNGQATRRFVQTVRIKRIPESQIKLRLKSHFQFCHDNFADITVRFK